MKRLNARRQLIVNAAYTSSQASPVVPNLGHKYGRFYLDVQAASGTGGLTLQVRAYSWNGVSTPSADSAMQNYLNQPNPIIEGNPGVVLTAPAAITAAGLYIYEIAEYPQAAHGAVQLTEAGFLPVYFDVQVVHGDASSYKYSVSADLI